ncbi:hypothetical protein DVH24_007773 [Malus domestica]|uniref:Uncharacterized protein n=1 Tax=Malus domestica TaxID=3750 RepID=A0A498JR82_MALDO|nr:hypothetical protein DVH24_007773 [Malus domestica]
MNCSNCRHSSSRTINISSCLRLRRLGIAMSDKKAHIPPGERCPTSEAKRLHVLHVTLLCCPCVRLENSPHMRRRVENESHVDGRSELAWAYKRLGYPPYC